MTEIKIGPEEKRIMGVVRRQEARATAAEQRRSAFGDWVENEIGVTLEEMEELPVTGCLDEAHRVAAGGHLNAVLGREPYRKRR